METMEEKQSGTVIAPAGDGPQGRGMVLTDDEFRLFSELIYHESGIAIKETKREFLQTRLQRRLQASRLTSYYRYYKLVTDKTQGRRELLDLVDSLTINETSFFRNKPQFDLLATLVVPDLIKRREAARRLRFWSAGCSRGHEPYSIAMTVLRTIPFPSSWDIKIIASDISLRALENAQRGIYTEFDMEPVEAAFRTFFFSKNEDGYQVAPHLKKLVLFDYHNLKHANGLDGIDAIFCRNVMIYFDAEEQKRLIEKFYHSLNPGGYLFLGHSETLQGIATKFRFIMQQKAAIYQKAGSDAQM